MGDVYYKLDKKTREELISTVKRVAIEILEGPQENWIIIVIPLLLYILEDGRNVANLL